MNNDNTANNTYYNNMNYDSTADCNNMNNDNTANNTDCNNMNNDYTASNTDCNNMNYDSTVSTANYNSVNDYNTVNSTAYCKTVKGQYLYNTMNAAALKFTNASMDIDQSIVNMLDDIANSMTDSELDMFTYGFMNAYYWNAWDSLFHNYNINMTVVLFRYLYDAFVASGFLLNQAVYHNNNANMNPVSSISEGLAVESLLINAAYDYAGVLKRLSGLDVALSK